MLHQALHQEKDALIRAIRLNPDSFIHPFNAYIKPDRNHRPSFTDIPLEDWLRALFESHLAGDEWGREITRLLKQTSGHIKNIFPKMQEDGSVKYMATILMSDPRRPGETRRFSAGTFDTILAAIESRSTALAVRDQYYHGEISFAEADAMFAKLRASAKATGSPAKRTALDDLLRDAEARASGITSPTSRQDLDKSR